MPHHSVRKIIIARPQEKCLAMADSAFTCFVVRQNLVHSKAVMRKLPIHESSFFRCALYNVVSGAIRPKEYLGVSDVSNSLRLLSTFYLFWKVRD